MESVCPRSRGLSGTARGTQVPGERSYEGRCPHTIRTARRAPADGRGDTRTQGPRGAGQGTRGIPERIGLGGAAGETAVCRIMGPFRPRHHILGSDIAGQVEAAGRNATLFQPGQDVFADILGQMGGFAEYVCVPQSALAPNAGRPDLRGSCGPAPGGSHRAAGHSRQGTGPARAEGADQRRRRPLGHVRRAARQAARGRGHRGGQHGEAGVHALTRRRICPNQSAATCVMPVLSAGRSPVPSSCARRASCGPGPASRGCPWTPRNTTRCSRPASFGPAQCAWARLR